MGSDIILKAEDLHFSYDDGNTQSLDGLSLEIRRGTRIACMGTNGSGKSTFFLCLNGILRPSSGTVYLEGKPIDYSRKGLLDLRRRVGIVFQDPDDQLFSASVHQEISFGLMNLGVPEDEARRRVDAIIDEMEIRPYASKPTHALSGGQKKQVSIADVLVMRPELVILDEPAAALDPRHTALVNRAVERMTADGITVVMATHDVNYAFEWADEVAVFHAGRVVAQGSTEEIFANDQLLAENNLEKPAAFELFDSLCERGVLSRDLGIPHTLKQLEGYIADLHA